MTPSPQALPSSHEGPPLRAPERLLSITALASRLGITTRALRHYEAIGLVSSHRGVNSLRLYDQDTIEILEVVSLLRRVDVPIADIRSVMRLRSDPKDYLQALHDLLEATLRERQHCVSLIKDLIRNLPALTPTN